MGWIGFPGGYIARPRAAVRSPVGQSRAVELIADLLKDRDPTNANELRRFDLIRRFHRLGRCDSIHGLRLVAAPVVDRDGKPCLSADGQPVMQRYVWELACFQYATGPEWKLVTWEVDTEEIHFQPCHSKQAARRAVLQSPASVLARSSIVSPHRSIQPRSPPLRSCHPRIMRPTLTSRSPPGYAINRGCH